MARFKGRVSKNVQDLRDSKKLSQHNAKTKLDMDTIANPKLRNKTPISKQNDVYTDVVNYANTNLPGVLSARTKRLIEMDTQVTPGKFETTDNLSKKKDKFNK